MTTDNDVSRGKFRHGGDDMGATKYPPIFIYPDLNKPELDANVLVGDIGEYWLPIDWLTDVCIPMSRN